MHNGGDAFLDFEVKESDITSGNAVVAVKKGNTVVWSWHLWFAPKDALNTIRVTNHQGVNYDFTKETLGWKPTQWIATTYDKPRTVKVKVKQVLVNGGVKQETVINITQNPGIVRKGVATLYQWGRKDAFPGIATTELKAGSITEGFSGNVTVVNNILNPDKFYSYDSPSIYATYMYFNLWSADNIVIIPNDNVVVKTVYDPCPAGFKMPANNAFSGFFANVHGGKINVDGTDSRWFYANFGHNFWTNSSKTATIYFPAVGYRNGYNGSLKSVGSSGQYWAAVPDGQNCSFFLYFGGSSGDALSGGNPRTCGFTARPVKE